MVDYGSSGSRSLGATACILVLVLSYAASAADYPPPVTKWVEKHPGAQVVGWRRYDLFRGDSVWRIKNNLEHATVDDSGFEIDPFKVIDQDRRYRHSKLGGMTDYLKN